MIPEKIEKENLYWGWLMSSTPHERKPPQDMRRNGLESEKRLENGQEKKKQDV